MTPQEIAQSYDQLPSHWDGEKFNRKNAIAQHERALQFSQQKRHAIDIGCGSSGRIIELLLAAGFVTEGLDISPEMLRRAQIRNPQQVFHLADICSWEFPQKYDFISAWDSIWHAPLENHEAVLTKLCGGLETDGILFLPREAWISPENAPIPFSGSPSIMRCSAFRRPWP